MHYTAAFRTTVPPPEPELFDIFEESGGVRPNLLLELQGPQERVLQHTVEHAGAICPFVQILDAPVPQTVDQLPNVVQFFAALSPVPEQVIEVPKILPHDVPRRHFCREPQLVEQLVEVPTILTPSFLRMLQNVDIPVPHGGRGGSGGLQGFLPGHVEQTIDISSSVQWCPGFIPEQSSTATSSSFLERISERNVEQIVDSRGFGGSLQDFRPKLSSSSSSHDPARVSEALDEPGEGFFRTFPQI